MALIVEMLNDGSTPGNIVWCWPLVRDPEANKGEFALVVADHFQHREAAPSCCGGSFKSAAMKTWP